MSDYEPFDTINKALLQLLVQTGTRVSHPLASDIRDAIHLAYNDSKAKDERIAELEGRIIGDKFGIGGEEGEV